MMNDDSTLLQDDQFQDPAKKKPPTAAVPDVNQVQALSTGATGKAVASAPAAPAAPTAGAPPTGPSTGPSTAPTIAPPPSQTAAAPVPGMATAGPVGVSILPPPPNPAAGTRSEGFTPGQIDQFLPPPQQPNGIPLNTAPNADPISSTMAIPGAQATTLSARAPTVPSSTPNDPTGHNRAYLGADEAGAPVWGDDGASDQSIRYDASGKPQWNAGLTGFGQADYDQRAKIAKMSSAELQAYVSGLDKQYSGKTTQTSANSSSTMSIDAMKAADPAAARAYQYAQQLIDTEKYDPEALKVMRSDEAIYGKNITDPDYLKRHHIGEAGYDEKLTAQQNKDRDALNATQGYSTIQGGQTFKDPAQAAAAKALIDKQMAAGGPAYFTDQQSGGTFNDDTLAQLKSLGITPKQLAAGGAGGAGGAAGGAGGSGKTREQQIADLMSEFVTPSRQTMANNDDPFSGVTTIDPGNDLRSTVITNTDDARTADYSRRVDDASSALPTDRAARATKGMQDYSAAFGPTDVAAGAGVNAATSDRLSKLNSLVDSASGNLAGVDRVKMAQDLWSTLSKEGEPAYELAQRQAAKRAAASGGFYGGKLRTDYGDLALARSRDLDTIKSKLVQQALSDSVQDQFGKLSALSGLEGQLSGQEAAQRGEQRTERGYATDVATGNVNRGLSAKQAAASLGERSADASIADERNNLSTLSDLEGRARGANETGINALRGERQYQVGQENDAFTRRFAQYQAEQNAKQQKFSNSLSLLGAGEAGNPSGTLGALADQMGDPGEALAQFAQAMGRGNGGNGGGNGSGNGSAGGFSLTGDPSVDAMIANIFAKRQNTQANQSGANNGASIDINSILPPNTIPGVQTTPGGGY